VKPTSVAAAGIALLLGCATFALGSTSTSQTRSICGVERWKVKTLQDRPKLHAVKRTTIAQLITKLKPTPLPGTRAPFEFNVFKVNAKVRQIIIEDDGDFHLVLSDGTHTMIAEAPNAACNTAARPYRRKQMQDARDAVKVCDSAQLIGVAFFDFFTIRPASPRTRSNSTHPRVPLPRLARAIRLSVAGSGGRREDERSMR
jgi:hypothetical protein